MDISKIFEMLIGGIFGTLIGSIFTYYFARKKFREETDYLNRSEHSKKAIEEVYNSLIVMFEEDVYDAQGNYVGLSNEKILEAESIIRNNRSLVEDEIIINLKLYKVAMNDAQSMSGEEKQTEIKAATRECHRVVKKYRDQTLDELKLNSKSGLKFKKTKTS